MTDKVWSITRLESKCQNCGYKHPNGCLRSNHLDKETEGEHIRYYDDGGMTAMITDMGVVIYLVDIEWCAKWEEADYDTP